MGSQTILIRTLKISGFGMFTNQMLIAKSAMALSIIWLSQGLAADTTTSPENTLSHTVSGFALTLNNDKDACQLRVENNDSSSSQLILLKLDTPCYWIVSPKTKVLLQYQYESIAVDNTLLVAGTPLDWTAEKKAYQKLPEKAYCTEYLQGIIISKQQVFAVNEKMVGAHCEKDLAIDEKIFHAMAHNPSRYQEIAVEPANAKTEALQVEQVTAKPVVTEEKSLFESVTDSLKALFSGENDKNEDAK